MSNKLVVIVGVLDKLGSTNISQAKSFYKLGFNVVPINYRTIITKYGKDIFYDILLETIKKYKPFLTVFSKCNGFESDIIDQCNKYTNTWLFCMDPIATIEQCLEVVEHAKRTHFSSCTGLDIAGWFVKNGVKNCFHLLQGVDQDVFKPIEIDEAYKADVSFIGQKTQEREEFRKVLVNKGIDVKFYGNGFGKEVINEEFAKVCSSSKFMLSMNTVNNIHTDYFSNRMLRY